MAKIKINPENIKVEFAPEKSAKPEFVDEIKYIDKSVSKEYVDENLNINRRVVSDIANSLVMIGNSFEESTKKMKEEIEELSTTIDLEVAKLDSFMDVFDVDFTNVENNLRFIEEKIKLNEQSITNNVDAIYHELSTKISKSSESVCNCVCLKPDTSKMEVQIKKQKFINKCLIFCITISCIVGIIF